MGVSEEAPALGVLGWGGGCCCQGPLCVTGQLRPFEPRWSCPFGGVSHAPLTAGGALPSCLLPPSQHPLFVGGDKTQTPPMDS